LSNCLTHHSYASDRCGDAPLLSFTPGEQKRRIHVAGPSVFDSDMLQAVCIPFDRLLDLADVHVRALRRHYSQQRKMP
jgi:hypothetical protein